MTASPPLEVPLSRRRALGVVLLAGLIGVVLLVVAPRPDSAWVALRQATGSVDSAGSPDPTAALLAVIGVAAWVLAAYLALAVLLTAAGRLPGLLGRLCAALAARTVPAVVRRTVGVALGLGLLLGPALPAQAAGTPAQGPGPTGTSTSLDWPAVTPPASATASGPARLAAPAPNAPPPTAPPAAAAAVVVEPGDTLWGLAERSLRADGRTPAAAAIAATWPSWWAANREAIGDDPDLLHPGTTLLAPPAS